MYYFDNKYLAQYLDQEIPLKVYVNSDWYEIGGLDDVQNQRRCVGYDEFGEATYFDYRLIEKLLVGDQIVTRDALNGEVPDEENPTPPEEPEEEPEPKEKPKPEPEVAWFSPTYDVGRAILHEWRNRK